MLETLFGWTLEYQNWGWNALTVSATVTFFLSLVQAWGTIGQATKIRREKGGVSVNIRFFAYRLALFASLMLYGWTRESLLLLLASFNQTFAHVFVIMALRVHKREGWLAERKYFYLYLLMVPVMIAFPWREYMVAAFTTYMFVPLVRQILEVWKERSAGNLDIRLIAILNFNAAFWIAYGVMTKDLVVLVFSPTCTLLYATLLFSWIKFRNPKRATSC